MRYCLTDIGLGANTPVTAINEYAFVGCAYLADIGLGTSERIVSIGNFACEDCKSLRLTNPETNTTISSIGKSCFKNTDMRGGLDLPKGLKITQIPQEAFCKTQHDFMYLLCNHAVMVAPEARLGYDFGPTITGVQFPLFPMASIRAASMLPAQAKS